MCMLVGWRLIDASRSSLKSKLPTNASIVDGTRDESTCFCAALTRPVAALADNAKQIDYLRRIQVQIY